MRRTSLLLLAGLALGLAACRTAPTKPDTGPTDDCTWYTDLDGDGWGTDLDPQVGPCEGVGEGWVAEAGDCDDSDAALHPGATETCDGRDQDCDGDVDEEAADAATWYADADADGYGDSAGATVACAAPDGFIADGSDCDDTDAGVHPGATERCNGRDDDCDGAIDEDVQEVWYADVDGDGYGNPGAAVEDCDPGTGWVGDATDCDDQDAGVHPGAEETCDDRDEDCDGEVDEGLGQIWYADGDGDGYGDLATSIEACDPGPGWVEDDDDCDDANSAIHPDATERCDGLDDDCDGLVDDDDPDVIDAGTWYTDADGDGYGDDGSATQACLQPAGTAAFGGDCDDMDPAYNPGAPETDCTDPNDYNCDGYTGYSDADGDGFAACEECDDGDASIFPGADEVCDGVDDDCDGAVDEADAVDAGTWYADADGDGYGDTSSALVSCIMPTGYVADDTDCDDGARTVHPGAPEVCDGLDQDCDGAVDEGVTTTFWADADGDGYGDAASPTEACSAPSDHVLDDTDCDDEDDAVYPGAPEVCDGVDQDCDGVIDDGVTSTFWADADGDGYGDPASPTPACSAPSGHVADDTDCDDTDVGVYPGADEHCDGVDEDCDGAVDEAAVDALT
ncbi:MAG: putative metal-binding motif-containing protein, partial [Pseudomonadota bacterium]